MQRPGDQTPRQQLGVLAISFDSVALPSRGQARSDHLDPDPRGDRSPVEPVPRRARLIARLHRPAQRPQPIHRRVDAGTKPHPRQLAGHHIDRRGVRRSGVDIEPDIGHRPEHGRTSSASNGVSRSRSPARQIPAGSVRPASSAGNPCNGRPKPYGLGTGGRPNHSAASKHSDGFSRRRGLRLHVAFHISTESSGRNLLSAQEEGSRRSSCRRPAPRPPAPATAWTSERRRHPGARAQRAASSPLRTSINPGNRSSRSSRRSET